MAPAVLEQLAARGIRLRREGDGLIAIPREALTDDLRALIRAHKPAILKTLREAEAANDRAPDPAMEARRQRVLATLRQNPNIMRAVLVDPEADPKAVRVAVALRTPQGPVSCELLILRERFDPFALLELAERHGATH